MGTLLLLLAGCGQAAPAASSGAPATLAANKPTASAASAVGQPPSAAGRLQNVTVSIPANSLSHFPLNVGKQYGIFERRGINITISQMKTDAAIAAAISGEVAYSTPAGSLIRAIAQGAPLKLVVTVMDRSNHLMLVNPKMVPTGKDLTGKRIALNGLGDNTQLEAEAVMAHFGADKKSAQFVVIPDDGPKLAAMQAGSVDAAIMTIPTNFKGEQLGFKTLINLVDVLELPTSILATNVSNISSHPAQVQAMVDATLEATRYAREHRTETSQMIAKLFDIDNDLAGKAYDLTKDAWSRTGLLSQAAFDNSVRPLELKPAPTLDKVWDPEFVQKSASK